MDKILLYLCLAVTTTNLAFSAKDKICKVLFTMSSICWWLLFVGNLWELFV